MALMTCPECGRQISSQATACPGCGCPVDKPKTVITFKKVPMQVFYTGCKVRCEGQDYFCQQGESVLLTLNAPAVAEITMENCFGKLKVTVEPGKSYTVGVNMFGKVTLA